MQYYGNHTLFPIAHHDVNKSLIAPCKLLPKAQGPGSFPVHSPFEAQMYIFINTYVHLHHMYHTYMCRTPLSNTAIT